MAAEKLVRTNLSFKGQAVNRGSRHSSQDEASELLVGRKSVGRQLPTADRELVNWQAGSLSLGGPRRRPERSTPFELNQAASVGVGPRACMYKYVRRRRHPMMASQHSLLSTRCNLPQSSAEAYLSSTDHDSFGINNPLLLFFLWLLFLELLSAPFPCPAPASRHHGLDIPEHIQCQAHRDHRRWSLWTGRSKIPPSSRDIRPNSGL